MATTTNWVVEYVREGGDELIDWELQEDGVAVTGALTRVELVLTNEDTGAVVTLDTDAGGGPTLDPAGNFRWASATGILSCHLGDLVPTTLPAGSYAAELVTSDAGNPNGVQWGRRQRVRIVVEEWGA